MSQNTAKCIVCKVILPLAGDINQPNRLVKFVLGQTLLY